MAIEAGRDYYVSREEETENEVKGWAFHAFLRPQRAGRVWRWLVGGRHIRYSLANSQNAPFSTRAQAAQAAYK